MTSSASGAGWRDRFGMSAAGRRVTIAALAGCATEVGVVWFMRPAAAVLAGWDTAAIVYLLWIWAGLRHLDVGQTRDLAAREALSGASTDLVALGAGVASLAAVGLALLGAGRATGWTKTYLIGIGVLSVVLSWTVVHTVYTLRYARAYYSPPEGGIEFNEKDPPTYLDFAYLSFTIGMTFQVSDTNITTKAVRRLALRQALLAYLFGAVILAVAINLVATLLS
jgi:uncharacterized membrane protein